MSTAPNTAPNTDQDDRPAGGNLGVVWLVVLATITMLAVRLSGYAALPFVVIFAPLLGLVGLLVLAAVIALIAALLTASVRPRV